MRSRRRGETAAATCRSASSIAKRTVAGLQTRTREQARQQAVGVRAVVDDPTDRVQGDGPGGGRRAHPSRSPAANRAPRAHAAPPIRLRPAGATSTRRTPPSRGAHERPRGRRVPTIVPGGRLGALVVDRGGKDLQGLSAEQRRRPGTGRSARTQRTIASGGRAQSIARSSGPIAGRRWRPGHPAARGGTPPSATCEGRPPTEAPRSSRQPHPERARRRRPGGSALRAAPGSGRCPGPRPSASPSRRSVSPARIACWTGEAPRHRGNSEKCRFTAPKGGMVETSRGE